MPSAYERKKAERERKSALGMVRKDVWVWPSAWPAIKAQIERLNWPERTGNDANSQSQHKIGGASD